MAAKKICALAGMVDSDPPTVEPPQPQARFEAVVADVRRVAGQLKIKPGSGLTRAAYDRAGGLYNFDAIRPLGGWAIVSAAAGFPSRMGQSPKQRRQWHKPQARLAFACGVAIADRG